LGNCGWVEAITSYKLQINPINPINPITQSTQSTIYSSNIFPVMGAFEVDAIDGLVGLIEGFVEGVTGGADGQDAAAVGD
jgi:hypothetical protein